MSKQSTGPGSAVGLGRWGQLFVIGMVAYSGLRALLVGETLGDYGVNPWLFLVIDAGSAVPMSVGQVRLVQAVRGRDAALVQRSLLVVGAAFVAPYAYLILGGSRPLPTVAYVVIACIVAAIGVATALRIRAETRAARPRAVGELVTSRENERR